MTILKPGNIYSGSHGGIAVLTNPTELAFQKGTLKEHYPVLYRGVLYEDAEAAYKEYKHSTYESQVAKELLCMNIILTKLRQYSKIVATIDESGGEDFIKACRHFVRGHTQATTFWEGLGEESGFIRCLLQAYQIVNGKWHET